MGGKRERERDRDKMTKKAGVEEKEVREKLFRVTTRMH